MPRLVKKLQTKSTILHVVILISPTLAEAADLIVQLAGSGSIRIADRDVNFPSRGRLSIRTST